MREHDWSASSLGQPETWPGTLRSVVNLILQSRIPMFVAWGPDLVFLYNDAYAEILSAKHPGALGTPFRVVWDDIWGDIGPLVNRAMAGETTYGENLPLTMRRNGYDEETWFTFSYSPVYDRRSNIRGMYCAVTETTGQVIAERSLRDGEARWRNLFQVMQEGFALGEMVYDNAGEPVDFQYIEVNGAWERMTGIPNQEATGRLISEVIPGIERHWIEAFARVVETGVSAHFEEYSATLGRWFEVAVYRAEPGRFALLFLNTTERRAAEEKRILLLREIDHRAKNALAVVQSMIRLTRAEDIPSFIKTVEGRVAALARAHTLLASQQWEGVHLHDMIRGELTPFVATRASFDGPPVRLSAIASQPLAMAVHELATNSAKHGALSVETGTVAVAWWIEGGDLHIRWVEQGGPPIDSAPKHSGFGSRVLDGTVRKQLHGTVQRTWHPSGLVCHIVVPLEGGRGNG
jgi:two-component sensor histidine kinase/PAS domain-containing protein